MNDIDLSHLIASRICHDLINPIGAIHNGLELMTLSRSKAQGMEFDLVQASATDARARVEFFRLAFGGQKDGTKIQADALIRLCAPIFPQPRYVVTWPIGDTVERKDAQIIVLALLCFEKQLPHGGQLWISPQHFRATPSSPRDPIEQWHHLQCRPISPPRWHPIFNLLFCREWHSRAGYPLNTAIMMIFTKSPLIANSTITRDQIFKAG
jgi:histidine phosphotransferase ChpT